MNPIVDIIVPTMDNLGQLSQCLESIFLSHVIHMNNLFRVVVINNGKGRLKMNERDNLKLINVGENLGWEGGLKLGLEQSKSPFVIFANDDIRLLQGSKDWLQKMLSMFNDPTVGAVGPCSNFVMGSQNIFMDNPFPILEVKLLIGFFMVLRREALEKSGGIDDTLPGGDDIDLSIRLRDAGYRLLCRRDIFVYHHGQQTGQRVHEGYWNSPKMQENTNLALIKKHGMYKFWETMIMGSYLNNVYSNGTTKEDIEGNICRQFVEGDKILELGCGGRKTVSNSIGVDLREFGKNIPGVTEGCNGCLADINSDVSTDIPVASGSQDTIIARHILEHCQDTLGTLSVWNRVLKIGGKLIIAVPHNGIASTILMNPEHCASFVPSSLKKMVEVCGFKVNYYTEKVNGISFVMICEKESVPSFTKPEKTVMPLVAQLMECA